VDGALAAEERRAIDNHRSSCDACSEKLEMAREIRNSVQALPKRMPPARLTTQLRVLASREIVRQRTQKTLGSRCEEFVVNFRLLSDNLMRPLAIPTAGGVFSALFLFGLLVPTLTVPRISAASINDVPTGLYTDATVKSTVPLSFSDDDVVVELTIDEQGRLVDYSIPACQHSQDSPQLRRAIENNLLFTQFTPATTFGQPKAGKIRLSFRRSHIEVKG
jgi:hypothetical protein